MDSNQTKLQKLLESRDKQLQDLTDQLQGCLKTIKNQQDYINKLNAVQDSLNIRLQKKENQINQEIADKRLIQNQITQLEKNNQPGIFTRITGFVSGFSFFKSKRQEIPPNSAEDVLMPQEDLNDQMHSIESENLPEMTVIRDPEIPTKPELPLIESYVSNDIDITKELEKLGIANLIKKY